MSHGPCLHRNLLFALVLTLAPAAVARSAPVDYEALKQQAEGLYERGSYAKARETYEQAAKLEVDAASRRWIDFRMADCLWRAQAATETADATVFDRARTALEALVRDVQLEADKDRVWAEVHESLGDMLRHPNRDMGSAVQSYQQALEWWAGSDDLQTARGRYLAMAWKLVQPPWSEEPQYYGDMTKAQEVLANAARIANQPADRARAHYLLAMLRRWQGNHWTHARRVEQDFEAALREGQGTPWYDDALYHYAEWLTAPGPVVAREDGQWSQEPDYVRAVELFRRLLREFDKGSSAYVDPARQQIENITGPALAVNVANVFVPDSAIDYVLNWRNVPRVDLELLAVDLTRDWNFPGEQMGWLEYIDLRGARSVKAWSQDTGDKGDHKPGMLQLSIDGKLTPGAYLLRASAGGLTSRELVLVTDAALVVKAAANQAVVYFCDARSGAPLAGGEIFLAEYSHTGGKWSWRTQRATSDAQGLAVFEVSDRRDHRQLVVGARREDQQAFSVGSGPGSVAAEDAWRIYAFTDRPAYRPAETARWKFIARARREGAYVTPEGRDVHVAITDPRGTKTFEKVLRLNSFGSAWGELELTAAMPLGEYRVDFRETDANGRHLGNAVLLRLEEYKLPEFKVAVATPRDGGKPRTYRIGEPVEAEIKAEYYFGGPVAGADVTVTVYSTPFHHWWSPRRDFPWFYEDMRGRPWPGYYGSGSVMLNKTLKTDSAGVARLTFDTPVGQEQDFEFRIEARVTDSSRREVVGQDVVRVTRQRYYVYGEPAHWLHRPQDRAEITFTALDAGSQPQQVDGLVKVTRDFWFEIWIDPDGRELKGLELDAVRSRCEIFPPPPVRPGGPEWRLKFRGYEHDEILTRTLKTDPEGQAVLAFVPEREGYYTVAWNSQDSDGVPIRSSTSVWVATESTRHVGYHHGGVDIIVDQDTFTVGQKAPIMISASSNDRYVLLAVESEELLSYQLVHLDGTVKLVQLDVQEQHVPNMFLTAAMVADRQLFMDEAQVVVPPVKNFLTVDVQADRSEYEPRQEGTLTVTARDYEGRPVVGELALAIIDESVFYIQQDYSADPRPFFYGQKRGHAVQTSSSFHFKSYARRDAKDDRQAGVGGERGLVGGFDEEDGDGVREGYFADDLRARSEVAGQRAMKSAGIPVGEKAGFQIVRAYEMSVSADSPPMSLPPGTIAGAPDEPAVVVRSDFRTTILWEPHVVTDERGQARVPFTMPDSLTGWKAVARAATAGNQFGRGDAGMRTRQPLMVRLQAPRFFVAGDQVVASAVIHNNTSAEMIVRPKLQADGLKLLGRARGGRLWAEAPQVVTIAAGGEERIDWLVDVEEAGEATLVAEARSDKFADAMQRSYPVHEHGIEKFITKAGKMRGSEVAIRLDLPPERKEGSTTLTVQVTPSLAVTMLDALPYLVHYPYGCTEQTMSRFLPAVVTARTLKELGLAAEDVAAKVFGGIEPAHAGKTHPQGKKDFDRLAEVTRQGLERLYDFQHGDGGWGWWKEGDSDHYMSAYVVWGLVLARQAGIEVREDALQRGVDYLNREIVEEEFNFDMQSWMLHALAAEHAARARREVVQFQAKALDNLWENRDRLNAYTRALLALAAHNLGDRGRAAMLVENLENGVLRDEAPDTSVIVRGGESSPAVIGTAHWGRDGIFYRWSDGGIEGTAFALMALLTIDPDNALVEPVCNWLIKNRRGAQWSNTRDTAITILALNHYLKKSGELDSDMEFELLVNGTKVAARKVTPRDILAAPSRFEIDAQLLRAVGNEIVVRRTAGSGPLYFAATAAFFSLEEPVTAAGHEIFVRRDYDRLGRRETLLKGPLPVRQPLADNGSVHSGERVEVKLIVEAKNDYEYLVFEDLKPAGLEAVEIRSGQPLFAKELRADAVQRRFERGGAADPSDYTGRTRWVYQELRDRHVAMFIDKLPQGVWEVQYELRGEAPGEFHALPVLAHAMYVPEIRANGDELRLTVLERE